MSLFLFLAFSSAFFMTMVLIFYKGRDHYFFLSLVAPYKSGLLQSSFISRSGQKKCAIGHQSSQKMSTRPRSLSKTDLGTQYTRDNAFNKWATSPLSRFYPCGNYVWNLCLSGRLRIGMRKRLCRILCMKLCERQHKERQRRWRKGLDGVKD